MKSTTYSVTDERTKERKAVPPTQKKHPLTSLVKRHTNTDGYGTWSKTLNEGERVKGPEEHLHSPALVCVFNWWCNQNNPVSITITSTP